MRSRHRTSPNQVLLFPLHGEETQTPEESRPSGEPRSSNVADPIAEAARSETLDVVLSGSFRKDIPMLRATFEELQDLGFKVLSPVNVNVVSEKDGFVFMEGEQSVLPESIELRHLEAISRAAFVWLHAPEGYVGPSAALEVGFARATGIPVYSLSLPNEIAFQHLVTVVPSIRHVAALCHAHPIPPKPAVQAFQAYYAKAALRRGYEKESAENTLLLMLEEFGELARAIRRRTGLRRDSSGSISPEEQELADVFIYVIHMANVLGFDLADAVRYKEDINIERFLRR